MRTLQSRFHGCGFGAAALIVLVMIAPGELRAQNGALQGGGFEKNRDYLALQPWEAIDTVTGNVILTFTDLELPGNNGQSLKLQRSFNNAVGDPNLETQWRFGVSGVPMRVTTPDIPVGAMIGDTVIGERAFTPGLYMADGSVLPTNFMYDPVTSNQSQLTATTRWVITPSFWRYDRISRTLYIPDGRVAQYDAQGWLTAIYDRFANAVTLTWNEGNTVLTIDQFLSESQSRRVVIQMNPTVWLPLTMTFEGKTWTYTYDTTFEGKLLEVQPPVVTGWPGGPGRPWRYVYEFSTMRSNMARVTTPQGGIVEYYYDVKPILLANGDTTDAYTLLRRTANSGFSSDEWRFDYQVSASGDLGGLIAMPPVIPGMPARRIVWNYTPGADDNAVAGGLGVSSVSVYEGASATPIEQDAREYQSLPAVRVRPSDRTWYVREVRFKRYTRASRVYETEYVYNLADPQNFANFHHPSSVIERTAGEQRRRTNTNYQHLTGPAASPYIVGLPSVEEVLVGEDRAIRSWTYDPTTGFRMSETALGSVTTFAPDAHGNVARTTKGNGKWTAYTYSFGQVATTTTSEPDYAIIRDINSDGTVRFESQAGRTTVYHHDQLGRVRLTETPGPTQSFQTDYLDETFGQSMTLQRGPSSTTTRLDGFVRVVSTANGAGVQTRTTYDAEGRRVFVSLPFEGELANPPGTTFGYDNLGRVVSERNADGSTRTKTYGANDTVTVTDENNNPTVLTYRTFGHPDDNVLAAVRDARGEQWAYEYNALDALTRVVSPGGLERVWNYDPDTHRLLSESHPESGPVHYTRYDAAGVLKERRGANNVTFTYQHDGNDRVTQIAGGGQLTNITYEVGSDNRASTTQGGIESRFFYDTAGRLRARDDTIDGQIYTRRFEYDSRDNLSLLTYPSGRRVSYGYDGENRITSVTDATANNRPVADTFDYHPSGALESYRAGNDLVTNITYVPDRYWVDTITVGQLSLDYAYDPGGNIRGIAEPNRPDYSQTFTYDEVDRLRTSSAVRFGPSTYDYDAHGNRVGAAYEYQPGTMRLIRRDTFTLTYDGNGNMKTAGPGMSFNYTSDNMMSDATVNGVTTVYEYDADQWRARKANTGSVSHFLRGAKGELLTEITDDGTGPLSVRDHIYAGSRLLSVVTATMTGNICVATIAPTSYPALSTGGPVTVSVTAQAGCAWTATSPAEWITVTAGSSGSGNGTVNLSVAANPSTATRAAVVTIAGRPFAVTQPGGGSGCIGSDRLLPGTRLLPEQCLTSLNDLFHLKLFPSGIVSLYGPTAEYRNTNITASAGAGWAEMVDGRFVIYDTNGAEVTAFGSAGHPGAFIVVQSDRNVVIYNQSGTQALWSWGTACDYVPAPLHIWVSHTGESKTINVASSTDCPWTAVSSDTWVNITSGATGSGTGAAQFTVAANSSVSGRASNLVIADHTAFVQQWGAPGAIASDRLLVGAQMYGDQYIQSPNGAFRLHLSLNGNLTLFGPNGGIWPSGSTPGPSFAEMLPDGRLVVFPYAGGVGWFSPTEGNPGAFARVRDDGFFVIESASGATLWSAGSNEPCTFELSNSLPVIGPQPSSGTINIVAPGHCAWTASSDSPWVIFPSGASGFGSASLSYDLTGNDDTVGRLATVTIGNQTTVIRQGGVRLPSDKLLPGQELYAGQEVRTAEGFWLVYQGDGNLVVYNPSGGVLWHSHTASRTPGFVAMQGDGNLVMYNAFGGVDFSTNTAGNTGAYLILHGDGNLVLYAQDETTILWQTGTGGN